MTTVSAHISTDPPAPAAPPERYSASQLLTTTTAHPAASVLTVLGDVDMLTSAQLNDQLLPHVRVGVPHVIVDLTGVGFFGAAGLTVLVNAREVAVAAGVMLCLVAATRGVLRPLRITGLDQVFAIHPNLTDALSRAGCGPGG